MCGIVGIFIKNKALQPKLGAFLSDMLIEMSERGSDSAGFAIYQENKEKGFAKYTLLNNQPPSAGWQFWADIQGKISEFDPAATMQKHGSHAVLTLKENTVNFHLWLRENFPHYSINAAGAAIEIYKEKGFPAEVIKQFNLQDFSGSHALGHTRMATESAVTTAHSHPFSTGDDICLVHNGSLSNHNIWRRKLLSTNIPIATDNDSEVAAAYFNWKLREGYSLDEALKSALKDLDGFYTFAIGTRNGFAVMRDVIGCKPAVLAETNDWVAMASEFRAIAPLPGSEKAHIWEPDPGRIYSWEKAA